MSGQKGFCQGGWPVVRGQERVSVSALRCGWRWLERMLFLMAGARVQRISAIVEKVAATARAFRCFAADLKDRAQVEALIKFTEKELGAVEILVNNAGIQHVSPVETFPSDKWDEIIALNLTSAFHATQLCLPGMRQRGWAALLTLPRFKGWWVR
ncbi:putative NAD(P)-dependent oxidoreductase [Trypanosoma cruzi]|uniref:3-oxoacyl-[acyl-carrier-protein] reductase n=1 Tax=Trypanosoma cruzi TaxID=5693 RepID=A0A2V2WN96_TRYCR|nr:putative NAD(P)-dependent oxidoreductase [Trypanosoma cruzi]